MEQWLRDTLAEEMGYIICPLAPETYIICNEKCEYMKDFEEALNEREKQAIKHILSDYKRVLKEAERYKNMYEAEHEIHLVRNEQLGRKGKAITRCNELENENKELKKKNIELQKVNKELKKNYINLQDNANTTFSKVDIPPEPQLPIKTLCESFSKKARNK